MIVSGSKNKVVTLLRKQPYSRVALARETGLVKSALTKVTKSLFEKGLLEEFSKNESKQSANAKGGRPELLLRVKSNCYFSVGIKLSTVGISAYLIDISGHIHKEITNEWTPDLINKGSFTGLELTEYLIQVITSLCVEADISPQSLKTICIATQGKIAQDTGTILQSQLLSEQNVNLAQLIQDRVNVPVCLYNIAYCSSYYLSTYRSKPNFIALLLGYGLGVGVCINNQVFLGPDGIAPEVSHLTYDREGRQCYCGAKGCAEKYVTYNAIFDTIEKNSNIKLLGDTPVEKLQYIRELLDIQNDASHDTIVEVGNVLGHIITQLISLFDVRTIYLNGETLILFEAIKKQIERFIIENNNYQLKGSAIDIIYEPDNDISTKGLLELTNQSYEL